MEISCQRLCEKVEKTRRHGKMKRVSFCLRFQLLTLVLVSLSVRTHADADDSVRLEYRIFEEVDIGTTICSVPQAAKLSAKYSVDEMRELRFDFLEQPDVDIHFFEIDNENGKIRTADRIDRDALCPHRPTCHIHLDVAVGPSKYFEVINVRIDILDKNDNRPTFPQKRLNLNVSEATVVGTSFGLPSAEDADSNMFGVQRYELHGDRSKFRLIESPSYEDSTDLRLSLRAQLDRERQDSYRLKVVAYDGGTPTPNSGTLIVNVRVTDANDNSPVFRNSTYHAHVKENELLGREVIKVMATDLDEGPNGEIKYGFSTKTTDSYGDLFGIKETNGAIYLKGFLDYESTNMFHLVVTAVDKGPNSHRAQTTVTIHVVDVNDNAPRIILNTLRETDVAQISEASDIDTFVAHLSVKDQDSGRNGEFHCKLNSDVFWLDQIGHSKSDAQYKIVTSAILDREQKSLYQLSVVCTDRGVPPRGANKSITVNVTDENDHAPRFSQQLYTANVPERSHIGIFILNVFATDDDIGDNALVKYSIEDLFARELFSVNSNSGIITTKTEFDHEEMSEIVFPIVARDQGSPSKSATAQIIVGITDKNDEKPVFTEYHYSFGVHENQVVGTEVGRVTASDRDSGPYQNIEYAIFSESLDISNMFVIDDITGHITTVKVLDREETPKYVIMATAANAGFLDMVTTATVTVHVIDENDNSPTIDFPADSNTSVMVSNLVPVGYVVTRVRAHDLDVGNNAKLTYQIIQGNRDKLFDIDTLTGAITSTKSLAGIASKVVPMKIRVVDAGIPVILTSEQNLTIVINKSVTYHPQIGSQEDGYSVGGNMIVVIALSSASALVLIILAIVLLIIRKQSIDRKKRTYRCRPEAQTMLRNTAADGKDEDSPDIMRSNGFPRGGLSMDPLANNHSAFAQTRSPSADVRQLRDPRANLDDSGTLRKQMLEKKLYDYAHPTPPTRTDSLEVSTVMSFVPSSVHSLNFIPVLPR